MMSITAQARGGTTAIFVNYRRDDSSGYAGRLFDRLRAQYGADSVFLDISGSIEPGVPFPEAIERAIASCGAILAIIGPEWLTSSDSRGRRRLEDPDDFVRLELAKAIRRGIRVIPILVQRTNMPRAEDLPEDLKALARYQAVELSDSRWDYDVSQLLLTLDKVLNRQPAPKRSIAPIAIAAAVVLALAIAAILWMRPSQPETRAAIEPTTTQPTTTQPTATQPGPASDAGASTASAPAPAAAEPLNRPASPPVDASSQPVEPTSTIEPAEESTPANAGTSTPVKMPNVRGRSLADARSLITQAGLRVGRVSYVAAGDVPAGRVMNQGTVPGVNVRPNASVALFVAETARAGIHAWGVLPLEPGFVYDLDGVGGREGPDIRVSRNQLNVSNGALAARVGTRPTREQCARTRLSTGAVTLQDGRFLCVQTSEQRLSALSVEGQNLRFETFASPETPRR